MKRVFWCAVLAVLPAMAAAQVADYKVEGDGIPKSLTGKPGVAARGKALLAKRGAANCLECHSIKHKELAGGGTKGPALEGIGPTPATDGRRVVAYFGSEGLYCYDVEGKLLWKRDLGLLDAGFFQAPGAKWGVASSPIVHDGVVYLQVDVLNDSYVAAIDLETGRDLWRTPRRDVPTWTTPTLHRDGDRTLLLVNGWKHIGGYDASNGREIWRLHGAGDIPVPAPVVAHGLAFFTSAHGPGSPIYAVRLDAQGDVSLAAGEATNRHVAWSVERGGAYMQTPLVYGDHIYTCRDNGVLTCYRARTGERLYQERLGGGSSGFRSLVLMNSKNQSWPERRRRPISLLLMR